MVFQEPMIEFVHLANEQVILTSAGYLICEKYGINSGSSELRSLCTEMHNAMGIDTYECVMNGQAAGENNPTPKAISQSVPTGPTGPTGPQVDFSLRFDK